MPELAELKMIRKIEIKKKKWFDFEKKGKPESWQTWQHTISTNQTCAW